jgi:hypothetical protein
MTAQPDHLPFQWTHNQRPRKVLTGQLAPLQWPALDKQTATSLTPPTEPISTHPNYFILFNNTILINTTNIPTESISTHPSYLMLLNNQLHQLNPSAHTPTM